MVSGKAEPAGRFGPNDDPGNRRVTQAGHAEYNLRCQAHHARDGE
jgi:hypothetical protein